jgi:hypothetical protein
LAVSLGAQEHCESVNAFGTSDTIPFCDFSITEVNAAIEADASEEDSSLGNAPLLYKKIPTLPIARILTANRPLF